MSELPIGLYDQLIDRELRERLRPLLDRGLLADEDTIDDADVADYLARRFAQVLRALLASASDGAPDATPASGATTPATPASGATTPATPTRTRALALVDELRDWITSVDAELLNAGELEVDDPPRRLLELRPRHTGVAETQPTPRPLTPLAEHALMLNSRGEPALAHEIRTELASADRVDLLIAFVKWTGIRLLEEPIRAALARGVEVRVLTTTYMGASDAGALQALARWGAQVRISHDHRRTRLHAKAWRFERRSGATTAYIGSSNLSRAAMLDGLEWNVRLAELEAPELLDKLAAAFETLWCSDEFEPFDADDAEQVARLEHLLDAASGRDDAPDLTLFDLRPHDYQQTMLDALAAERAHGHSRNLVVAPTGVGKTMVAAFDYARLCTEAERPRLLFVAHRERLLDQSLTTFRQVLRDPAFGEKLVGGARPRQGTHVFASIQSLGGQLPGSQSPGNQSLGGHSPGSQSLDSPSLARKSRIEALDPRSYDVVIIDEFHHAAAPSYRRLLEHVQPRILLGLTATPERHDEQDILSWFDHRIASEMRLWDALEERLLAPFQYFGVHDGIDLADVRFTRGRYDVEGLDRLYTGNDARVRLVLQQLRRVVGDAMRMRALGFCVSVQHAHFMARRFSEAGLPSRAVTGEMPSNERERAIRDLERGQIVALFTVDLFNEGVDIPSVDTVLFLRPTESATVFLQQLGRGLRLHPDKACLTVLDFIGNAHADFRFDLRFRALMGGTTRQVQQQIEDDFPYLPPGCALQLDRVAREVVLRNLKSVTTGGVRWLRRELQALGPETSLASFLDEAGVDLFELYSGRDRSWTALRDAVFGRSESAERTPEQRRRLSRLGSLLHVDDDERLDGFRRLLTGERRGQARGAHRGEHPPTDPGNRPRETHDDTRERRLQWMLTEPFFEKQTEADLDGNLAQLTEDADFVAEALELLDLLDDRRRTEPRPWVDAGADVPLQIHGHYRRDEVLAALHILRNERIPRVQAGVFHAPELDTDLLFVTLKKTERGFSPKTMYRDYALTPSLFHWESQHNAHPQTRTGQRYLDGSSRVLLFVRHQQKWPNGLAEPFVFLGPVTLESARGSRPMQIVWRLEHEMPASLIAQAQVAVR